MRAVVLSSFPRSGNTWVRFVLATAMLGERPSSFALDEALPDAHKALAPPDRWLTDPALILKSHFRPGRLAKYLEAFNQAAAPKGLTISALSAVHVVRNPFDTAISVKKFYGIPDAAFDRFFEAFIDPAVVAPSEFAQWGFGNWHINSREWLAVHRSSAPPTRIVRYEDLVARPLETFGDLLEWMDVRPKRPLEECIELCSAGALRSLEKAEVGAGQAGLFGSYHAGSAEGGAFINGATSGGYRTTLRPDQIAAGLARLGPLMADLGYDAEAYRSAA